MSLRFHEIAEGDRRLLNPFSERKLDLVGEICRLEPGHRVLDLACGKGELLARWSRRHGIAGTGVDLSEVFLAAARERAAELGVTDRLTFEWGDAGAYRPEPGGYDLVGCIGATWIGGGLVGTVRLMRPALAPGGYLVVGEPFWHETPTPAGYAAMGVGPDDFADLVGTLDRFAEAGCELVEMVLGDLDEWDRYAAAQWLTVSDHLAAHPDAPDADELRAWSDAARRTYLAHTRRTMGWGVFILRVVEWPAPPRPGS